MTEKPIPTAGRPISCRFDNGVEVVLARHAEGGHFLVYTLVAGVLADAEEAPNMLPYATVTEARIDARGRCEAQLLSGARVVKPA